MTTGEESAGVLQQRMQQSQQLTNGTRLNLSNLAIESIPTDLAAMFPTLQSLDLHHNALTSLPHDFAQCFPHLVILNLADNHLTSLPDAFGSLQELKKLTLARNQLASLPTSVTQLQALEEVDLSSNQILSLDDGMGSEWKQLRRLNLSFNPLREVPRSLTVLPLLATVNLTGIDDQCVVPDSIRRLHERQILLHSRAKRRELISRALRVRSAVNTTLTRAQAEPALSIAG